MNNADNFSLQQKPRTINFRFILPLAFFFITIYLSSTAVAYKLISLGPMIEPGPPFIFPLSYALMDVIAEVYGYKIAKSFIWLTLFFQFIFVGLVTLVIHLPSPAFWHLQSSYNDVFGNLFRFVIAGTIATLASNFINAICMAKWKIRFKGKHFIIRSIASSAVAEFSLITLIVLIGYSGTINRHAIIQFTLSIFALEMLYAVITAWPAKFIAKMLKTHENIDTYDYQTNFNPFSIK